MSPLCDIRDTMVCLTVILLANFIKTAVFIVYCFIDFTIISTL